MADAPANSHALRMVDISKVFGTTEVLTRVDFEVGTGEVHALAGSNGAGKSTLMKIARGVVEPTTGEVYVGPHRLTFSDPTEPKRAGLAMVFQELSLAPTLSALDNVFLAAERTTRALVDETAEREEATELLERLGVRIDLNAEVYRLGVAEQQMVEIAKALRLARVALLLDEPTGALSIREVRRLFEVLRQVAALGVGIVFVTHHLGEIFEIADRVTVLRDGAVAMSAPIGDVSLTQIVHAMVGQEFAELTEAEVHPVIARDPLLHVEDLGVAGKLDNISFAVHQGEICGLAGLAGSGRTVLLKALFGTVRHSAGRLTLRGEPYHPAGPADAIDAGVYLIPENRRTEGLVLSHAVGDNLVLSLLGRLRRGLLLDSSRARSIARAMVDALKIKPALIDPAAESLSGGNQQKVVLGKALATESRLLLLDEPTFGIDVTTAADIRARVRRFADEGGAAIWVSSDLREVIEVADRILVLADGHIKQVLVNRPTPVSEARLLHAIQRSASIGEGHAA